MFGILDRYIFRETMKTFLAILSILMLILISHAVMRLLQKIAAGAYNSEILAQMVGLESLTVVGIIAPPAFFFAILYSLGRMYRDSEMTALFAGGVGMGRIYRIYLLLAIPLTLVVAGFTLYVIPEVNLLKESLKEQRKEQANLTHLPVGRFHETKKGALTYYFERLSDDGTQLEKIFVQNKQQDALGLITASAGIQRINPKNGDRFIVLQNGKRYSGNPGESSYSIGKFKEYAVRVDKKITQTGQIHLRARPTLMLTKSDDIRDQAELQGRILFPLAILVFTLVSIPLSRSMPREGVYGRLVLAVLFYFIFINVMTLSEDWMRSGATPLWLGRWWVHPFMLLLTGVLLYFYTEPSRLKFWRKFMK